MYSSARRKSIDSSDSSDSSGSEPEYQKKDKKEHKDKSKKKDKGEKKSKDKKDKDKDGKEEKKDKDKKDKDKDKDGKDEKKDKSGDKDKGHASAAEIDYKQARFHSSQVMDLDQPHTLPPNQHFGAHPPPHGDAPPHHSSSAQSAPPSGYRVPLTTNSPFPAPQQAGAPVSTDADGSPLFVGSALFDRSVQPCKIGPHLQPYVMVPYGGAEYGHHGRFDLLPFSSETMEWVPTSGGHIPSGRKPIEGGYEESGQKLYHALGQVQGTWIPGKTSEHLGGANVPFAGQEIPLREYSILCWR